MFNYVIFAALVIDVGIGSYYVPCCGWSAKVLK